ncbi:hypothetical protein Goari_027373 [Gossypium aridum]|uniref:DUF7745 domain-containing protein n=1 Tax=Gossypium aridum TaxID=34290 RepID=A0A7J8YVK0_GOSAI|nr:hypothetical protein [Gossypium aridum]
MNISGMSEQWVAAQIKQKGDGKCIPWNSLRDLILAHPDLIFALSIYELVVFPKALGHVDEVVSDLFDRLDKKVTPVPVILAETFRSLNMCRRAGEGRFIGCAQLLLAWFHNHLWRVEKVSYRVFSENYSSLKELVATRRRDDISKEKWMAILQNLQDEDYRLRQFIQATHGLAQCEFSYKGDNYKKKVRDHQIKSQGTRVGKVASTVRNHNSTLELKASLNKIEELKRKIEKLKTALQNCELRVELLEANNEHWKEQLHHSQVQGDVLSLKYESESDRGQELAWLLKKVKALSIREKPYMFYRDKYPDPTGGVPMRCTSYYQTPTISGRGKRQKITPRKKENEVNNASMYNKRYSKPITDLGERPGKVRDFCKFHDEEGHEIQECIELRALIQGLMDNKELEFFKYAKGLEGKYVYTSEEGSTKKVYKANHPVVIISRQKINKVGAGIAPRVLMQKLVSFPYKDSKRFPWSYDCNVTILGEENPVSTSEEG